MTKSLTRKALTLSASAATISGLTVTQHLWRRHWKMKRRHVVLLILVIRSRTGLYTELRERKETCVES